MKFFLLCIAAVMSVMVPQAMAQHNDTLYVERAYTLTLADVTFDSTTGELTDYRSQYTNIIIPDQFNGVPVTSIGDKAFFSSRLVSVVIPNSVTVIGKWAFFENKLMGVIIPESVVDIEVGAFADNPLRMVSLSNTVVSIENKAFYGNELTTVLLPDSVTFIGDDAFFPLKDVKVNKSLLTYMSDGVESIGDTIAEAAYAVMFVIAIGGMWLLDIPLDWR